MKADLQVTSVKASLGGVPVLHDISASFASGQWTCIVGPNGAGKSTLLKVLAGLLPPSHSIGGNLQLLGKPYSAWPAKERARSLAWLGQGETVPADMTAQDVVMLGRLPHQGWLATTNAQDQAAIELALHSTHTRHFRGKAMGELSGGERQRVLLARLLAIDAQVLLMDEPLANLDPPYQADWLHLVKMLIAAGKTIITVLHELPIAVQADALLVLSQGRVICQGSPRASLIQQGLQTVFDHRIRISEIDGELLVRLAF